MQTCLKFTTATVVLALVVVGPVSTARAGGIVYGKVEWTASNAITFRDYSGGVVQLQVDLNARILLNGRRVQLVDLKPGTPVTVYYENGPFAPYVVAIVAVSRFGQPGGG
jgi:hypothetical protein